MKNKLLFILCFILIVAVAKGQNKVPKIGFAFSGGGAKGLAHVGVLKVLEEEGIIPDYIAGTSMGSIVGGLYAIGYSAEQLETLTKEIIWDDYFNDNLDRSYLAIEEKSQADRYQVQFPFNNGRVKLPTGFVGGQKIGLLLSQLTVPVHGTHDFNDFQIPFRAIATDLVTGTAVVINKGFLPDAIRASMSIPTVFQPVVLNKKLLADGGLTLNLPVDEVLDMGADIVIALDVGGELYKKDEFSSVLRVLEQTGSYLGEISNQNQRSLASVVISPDVKDYSPLSFSDLDSLIQKGEDAAREILPRLKFLLKDINKRTRPSPNQFIAQVVKDTFLIQAVDYDVDSKASVELLRSIFKFKTPNRVSLKTLNEQLKTVYSSRFFRKIDYRLLPADGNGYILSIRAIEQSGNFLKASANYDSDYGGGILLNATFRNTIFRRSKFSVDLRVSEKPSVLGEYVIYTPTRPNFGIRASGGFNFFTGLFFNNNELLNEFDWRHGRAQLDFFTGLTSRLSLAIGYGVEGLSQNKKFFDPDSDEVKLSQQYAFFSLNRDTYNRLHFPTRGSLVSLTAKGITTGNITRDNINSVNEEIGLSFRAQAEFTRNFRLHEVFTLRWYNSVGYQHYENGDNLINLFFIGRALPNEPQHISFQGLRYMEQPADRYAISGLSLQLEVFNNKFLTGHVNYGYYHSPKFDFFSGTMVDIQEQEDELLGVALEAGLLTGIGPASFSTQYNVMDNRFNFVLHLGYIF